MLLLRVPLQMREVVDVVIYAEFRGEIDLDVGVGQSLEQLLIE